MMQFRLRTLMLVFVILWSSLAACGYGGIFVTLGIVMVAATIHLFSKPTLKEWLVAMAIIGVLVALLLPAVQTSCGSPTGRCINNLHNLTLALLAYHDQYGSFPPAYVADKAGKPMHSCAVQCFPFSTEGTCTTHTISANRGTAPQTRPCSQQSSFCIAPVIQIGLARTQPTISPATLPSSAPRRPGGVPRP